MEPPWPGDTRPDEPGTLRQQLARAALKHLRYLADPVDRGAAFAGEDSIEVARRNAGGGGEGAQADVSALRHLADGLCEQHPCVARIHAPTLGLHAPVYRGMVGI